MFLLLVLTTLTACGAQQTGSSNSTKSTADKGQASASNKVIEAKIGVISYLSGPGAAYGEAITNGLKLAQGEINQQYKGKLNINLVIEDSAGKQEQALSAAQKFYHLLHR